MVVCLSPSRIKVALAILTKAILVFSLMPTLLFFYCQPSESSFAGIIEVIHFSVVFELLQVFAAPCPIDQLE
jgi:hypothetical protein